MASLGLTSGGPSEVATFGFLDPPDKRSIAAGVSLLEELGALTTQGRLTKLGRRLARLPIDPRLARMIVEAERLDCLRDVLVIAAALSLQDPRERPAEERPKADQFHARFTDQKSDFMTWLNLWTYLAEQQRALSSSAFRRMCKREFLNYLRVREWQDFESQLRQVTKEMGIRLGAKPPQHPNADRIFGRVHANEDAIHQALLSGLLSQIGSLEEREKTRPGERAGRAMREYAGARGTRFAIFPGSGLRGKNPQFLMAGELVETSRLWARQNAAIEPEWAERLGSHLSQEDLFGAALVGEANRRDGLRTGHFVRRHPRRGPTHQLREDRRQRWLERSSSGMRWSTASGTPTNAAATHSSRRIAAFSRRQPSLNIVLAGETSWSTSTPSSTSTTRGSARKQSAARTSTRGGRAYAASNRTS